MFYKAKYWENRKLGKRGQGEYPIIEKVSKDSVEPGHMINVGGSIVKVNREKYRNWAK